MRKSDDESLDEFVAKVVIHQPPLEPPSWVSLRSTGEVEVLKPLVPWANIAKPKAAVVDTKLRPDRHGLSLFHRSLAVGGALAVLGFVIVSAIFIGMDDRSAEPVVVSENETAAAPSDLATDVQPDGGPLPAEESPDTFTVTNAEPVDTDPTRSPAIRTPQSAIRTRKDPLSAFRPRTVLQSAIRDQTAPHSVLRIPDSKGSALRTPHSAFERSPRPTTLIWSDFVPTTLIIYIENGQVKTRIEPQSNTALKKPQTLSN